MRPIAHVTTLSTLLVWGLAACEVPASDKSGTGDTGDSTNPTTDTGTTTDSTLAHTGSTTDTGTAPEVTGWTVVPLLDDGDVWHAGNDLVTGIHFASLDDGFVVTTGARQNSFGGGAVFGARRDVVERIAFAGFEAPLCQTGSVDFVGLAPTARGVVALAHACDLIESTDGGASFTIRSAGLNAFGIETVLAWNESGDQTRLIRGSGVVSESSDAPGPDALWDDVWAPVGIPPIPNPVPDDQCQDGPRGSTYPELTTAVRISADGQHLAYVSHDEDRPLVCLSDDAGRSFFPHLLNPSAPAISQLPPLGVVYATDDVALTWFADRFNPERNYVYRSTDGGVTWQAATLSPDVATLEMELRQMFFAPGGRAGWVVGYDHEHDTALLLKTTDGGETWSRSGGDLARLVSDAGGGKLWSGFALDEDHLWVGGEYGVFAYNAAGGE